MRPVEGATPWRLTPAAVLLGGAFWKEHRDVLAVLALDALGLLLLLPLTLPGEGGARAATSGPRPLLYAALAIFPLVALGAYRALQSLEHIYTNRAIARHLCAYARGIWPSMTSKPTLDRLSEELAQVVSTTREPQPAMLRLSQALCANAVDGRFDPTIALIPPYQRESAMGPAELESIQRLALRLGILGAFVGLLYAIGVIPQTLGEMSRLVRDGSAAERKVAQSWELFQQLGQDVFGALSMKFGASVSGLYVAVAISLLGAIVRRRQMRYFQDMEDAAAALGSLCLRCEDKGEDRARLQNALERLIQQQQQERTAREELIRYVGLQTQAIEQGVLRLAHVRAEYDGLLQQVALQQASFLADMRALYDAALLRRQLEKVEGTVHAGAERVAGVVTDHAAVMRGSLERIEERTLPWWRRLGWGAR
jgi:hypothetical protein